MDVKGKLSLPNECWEEFFSEWMKDLDAGDLDLLLNACPLETYSYSLPGQRMDTFRYLSVQKRGSRLLSLCLKKILVGEIYERKLLSEDVLRNKELLYLGSSSDIELPLALGARKIRLLDPVLRVCEPMYLLAAKIRRYSRGRHSDLRKRVIEFEFDFGAAAETVELIIDQRQFSSRQTLCREVGILLTFRFPIAILERRVFLEQLPKSCLLISDHHPNRFRTWVMKRDQRIAKLADCFSRKGFTSTIIDLEALSEQRRALMPIDIIGEFFAYILRQKNSS